MTTYFAAADAVLQCVSRFVDAATDASEADNVAAASIAVAEAHEARHHAGLPAANKVLDLVGTSATDRDWRKVRTRRLHDPVRWNYHGIGTYHLNGRRPSRHGTL